jgi:hypothetical protein
MDSLPDLQRSGSRIFLLSTLGIGANMARAMAIAFAGARGSPRLDVTLTALALGLPNTAIVDPECNRDYAENCSQSCG